MFSDLNFYKILKVKRKVNKNVMIKNYNFLCQIKKNLIKMLKAPTLPPAKKSPVINPHLIYRLKNEDLDVLGDVGESKRKTFS